jgi:hypothetical protein
MITDDREDPWESLGGRLTGPRPAQPDRVVEQRADLTPAPTRSATLRPSIVETGRRRVAALRRDLAARGRAAEAEANDDARSPTSSGAASGSIAASESARDGWGVTPLPRANWKPLGGQMMGATGSPGGRRA